MDQQEREELELQCQSPADRHQVDSRGSHSGGGGGGGGSFRRAPSMRLLRQVSSRAGSTCMTALGLKRESPSASQKWNQRRLLLLSSYGNLKVGSLEKNATATAEAAAGESADSAVQVGRHRLIDRQLSCPTARISKLMSSVSPPATPLVRPTAPPTAPPTRRLFDSASSDSRQQRPQSQRLLRRHSVISSLYRGVRSLSLERRQSQEQPGSGAPAEEPSGRVRRMLEPLPEEGTAPTPLHLDLRDYKDLTDGVTPAVSPFDQDFRLAANELNRVERLASDNEDEVFEPLAPTHRPSPLPPPPAQSAGLLARLRLSCLTDSDTANLMADLDHHLLFRPYFTYWISAVHAIVFIATVVQFGFAPFGVTLLRTGSATVVNRNTLQVKVCAIDYHNLFIGPRMSDLIRVGAKYSLCMRRYDSLYRDILDRQLLAESQYGCCVHNDGSACYQSRKHDCPAQMSTWLKWDNGSNPGPDNRISGPVCGQDPRTCQEPYSPPGLGRFSWPDDISRWPACLRQIPVNSSGELAVDNRETAHLVCPISARPCCVGIKGECVITSQQRCSAMRGVFFPDRQLCSQVNCIGEACGMLGVSDPQQPNQFYRVFTSLFLHSGLVTLAVSLVHHVLFLHKLEQSLGWHRTAFIYIGSGVMGNLVSMIFLPYLVDVGPTSAQIGSLAPIFIEMSMSWSLIEDKLRPLCLFILSPLVLVVFGFFPWFDNFANLGGLVSGLLLSVVLMPYVHLGSAGSALLCRRISVAVCLIAWLSLLIGLWVAFYLAPLASCDFCVYFNCGPKWFDGYFTDQSHVDYCGNANLSNLEPTRCVETLAEQLS